MSRSVSPTTITRAWVSSPPSLSLAWAILPCRSIRTADFLYIRNYRPDRWPAGTPNYRNAELPGGWYADCDNGPTKTMMIKLRDEDDAHRRLFHLAFAKRPAEELYDLKRDPGQLENVAGMPNYAAAQKRLSQRLTKELKATGDPRETGGGEKFDEFPYYGNGPKHPAWQRPKKKK